MVQQDPVHGIYTVWPFKLTVSLTIIYLLIVLGVFFLKGRAVYQFNLDTNSTVVCFIIVPEVNVLYHFAITGNYTVSGHASSFQSNCNFGKTLSIKFHTKKENCFSIDLYLILFSKILLELSHHHQLLVVVFFNQ